MNHLAKGVALGRQIQTYRVRGWEMTPSPLFPLTLPSPPRPPVGLLAKPNKKPGAKEPR